MGQPEGFVQMTPGLIDDEFRVTVPATEEFLRAWLAAAVDHVALHA
jgi:chromate reductase